MQPIFLIEGKTPRLNIRSSNQRRLSVISKNFDNEYHNQQQVAIIESKLSSPLPDHDGTTNQRRLTQIISLVNTDQEEPVTPKGRYLLLFIFEPIIVALFILPIIVIFWDCGWNLVATMLNALNGYPLTYNLDGQNYTDEDYGYYSPQSLVIPYAITEFLFLIFYLGQNLFYDFLKRRYALISWILLKIHILILAFMYIFQWEMIWTILDQYTPQNWEFMMVLSLASLFALMVLTGTLSDLICSPFVVSYDSVEYCIKFECPLELQQMSSWKINLINFILYEIIISNITILIWHGFYVILDQYLYPDDNAQSAWICLIIGYTLFFPLIYCQFFSEKFNWKSELMKGFSNNFPQFYRNIYHGLAFASCLFVWRGLWVLYDTYLSIFEDYYKTYLLISLISFVFLSMLQTFSSMNGPLSTMQDTYQFFPVYAHCYVSTVIGKLSELSCFQRIKVIEPTKVFPYPS